MTIRPIVAAAALAFAGCTSQLGKFTVFSPDPIDLTKSQYTVDKSQKLTGIDHTAMYLVYCPNTPQYAQAVRNAIAQKPGAVGLADVTLTRKSFWLLFGYCDFIAEGYPIIKKEGK